MSMTNEALFWISIRLLTMGVVIFFSIRRATRASNERARQAEMQCEHYEKKLARLRAVDAATEGFEIAERTTELSDALDAWREVDKEACETFYGSAVMETSIGARALRLMKAARR